MNDVEVQGDNASVLERVVVQGDLSKLSPEDRVMYYAEVCKSLGLNPLTQPFAYITLNGKLTLYAKRDATDQLRNSRNVSVQVVGRERIDDVYVVTARATMPNGRTDESIGAVSIGNLKGDALANALMKAETKAKRRVTLSVCGLGLLDETETETIRGATLEPIDMGRLDAQPLPGQRVTLDGEILDAPKVDLQQQLAVDIKRIITEANGLSEPIHKGKLRLLGQEADRKGLLSDPEVLAALSAAKERLREASRDHEAASTEQGQLIEA